MLECLCLSAASKGGEWRGCRPTRTGRRFRRSGCTTPPDFIDHEVPSDGCEGEIPVFVPGVLDYTPGQKPGLFADWRGR